MERRRDSPKTSRTRPSKVTMRFGPAATSSRSMTAKVPGASLAAVNVGGYAPRADVSNDAGVLAVTERRRGVDISW